jgi:hypothetical protein
VRALACVLAAAALGAGGQGNTAPACSRVTIGLNGATGGGVAVVRVSDRGRSTCRLVLSVRRADGTIIRRIRGNPALLRVRRRFWLVAGTARVATAPPACASRAAPSTLRRFAR